VRYKGAGGSGHRMPRLIKRYENRKLYDVADKRYVSLEAVAVLVRAGEDVSVIDNATGADLTAQTLAKVIVEESATTALPAQFLHDLLRASGRVVAGGMEQLQHGLDRMIEAAVNRLPAVRETREQMDLLRQRLEQIEHRIETWEEERNGNNPDRTTGRTEGRDG
jgi:polyhydroxyalkanoate synthesis repressor PhaR